MIVVISCAGGKRKGAGKLKKDGKPVEFVAHPKSDNHAHPDCTSDYGISWREKLLDYNRNYQDTGDNPDGLLEARKLYRPQRKAYREIYDDLANKFAQENVYILSAGWGLVRSDFLLPHYDITFNKGANKWKVRNYKEDTFLDFNHLAPSSEEIKGPIVFMGGKAYVDLFIALTEGLPAEKIIYFYSEDIKTEYLEYSSEYHLNVYPNLADDRTWYFQCAQDFIDCKIEI